MTDDAMVPDDKDWTWVLDRRCLECGLDVSELPVERVAGMIRANAASWAEQIDAAGADVGSRVRPDRWSMLEYAAHVRDVYVLFHQRLQSMLDTDDPLFDNWNQDDTAMAEGYGRQDPIVVRNELVAAATAIATSFDSVADSQWQRPGRRSDGAGFTVETFARYLIHDPVHHLWDVTTG